jgi:arginyl-tRNA--protein-N-Asp/Glu arginylyltransferase
MANIDNPNFAEPFKLFVNYIVRSHARILMDKYSEIEWKEMGKQRESGFMWMIYKFLKKSGAFELSSGDRDKFSVDLGQILGDSICSTYFSFLEQHKRAGRLDVHIMISEEDIRAYSIKLATNGIKFCFINPKSFENK